MDIKEISDRLELEKLVTEYATAVDTRNFTEFNNLFTADAIIDYTAVGGISGNLKEIIVYLETALDFFPNYQHFISNISLTITGNNATGKVMCFNPMQTKENQVFFLGIWYHDTYINIDDRWFISSRIEESSWSHNVPTSVNTEPQK
ncbi:nuclear transport factor 2 family protein [Gammaproteobacteria bacterium]|nr:nuclear transport factor 2 family protein [Gammaproteobacteria bacterium]